MDLIKDGKATQLTEQGEKITQAIRHKQSKPQRHANEM